ncbi:MAG: serine/threonine protein kinase [Labilithrix sp.]|nr:serine/threonine protein kinase [Labilithrix sp.]
MHPEGRSPRPAALPGIGQTLGGKYEIVRLLGEGGMAYVFEASHRKLQQRVAIKLLAPEFAKDPELVQRFEREARNVARLRTKHVARVMDVDQTEDAVPFIVMEFLEGRDLDAELQARSRLPVGEAVDYVLQACAAMVEAHGVGLIHRDLKPANLFLASDGGDRVVKVLDFGISKVMGEATRLTVAGAVMGTVMYMSPEQVRAHANVDTRADVWAMGVILYELIAGRAPWEGSSPQIAAAIVSTDPPDLRASASVPEGLADSVRTMLQREPDRRFASIRDVVTALAPFVTPGSIGAAAAEQITLAQSGARSAAAKPNFPKNTVPMIGSPRHQPPASGPVTPRSVGPSTPAMASARGVAEAPPAPRGKLVLALAAAAGVIGAAGVVLILVVMLHGSPPATTGAAPPAASSVVSPASAPAPSPPAPSASASDSETPPPPSTGTTPRATGAPSGSARRVDAGATRAHPAPPKPSENPALL